MSDVNLGEARQFDYDTGGGVDLVEVSGIVFPASGAAVPVGGVLETGTSAVGTLAIGGGTPHDSVDSGNPIKIGGKGVASAPSATTDGDRVNAWFSQRGAMAVMLTDVSGGVFGMSGDALKVEIQGSISIASDPVGSALKAEDSAAANADLGMPILGQRNDTDAARTSTDGDYGFLSIDSAGKLKLAADKFEDAAGSNGDVGILILGQRNDGPSSRTSTDGDYSALSVDDNGRLRIVIDAYNPGTMAVRGDVAHDSVDSGNPIKVGGKAGSSVNPTAVSPSDRVDAHFDTKGRQVVVLASGYDGTGAITGNTPTDAFTATAGINAQAMASVYNGTTWDRARSIQSLDAAPNVDTGVLAVGAGPGWDRKTNPTGVAATSTANAVTVVTDGADVMQFHVTAIGTTPGAMIFETTGDDSNWATAGFVLKLSTGPDVRIEGAFVPAVNDVYMVRTTGVRQVRYRVQAVYASGTATVKVTGSMGVGLIKAMDVAPPPHNIGYAETGYGAQYSTTQTSTTIGPTVSSTQRLVVTKIQIDASGTVAGDVQVYFGTGAFTRGTSPTIFDGGFKPSATLRPGVVMTPPVPWMGAADQELKVTTSAAIANLTVTFWGYLVAA